MINVVAYNEHGREHEATKTKACHPRVEHDIEAMDLVWQNNNPAEVDDFQQNTEDDLHGLRALEAHKVELGVEQAREVLELNGNPEEAECHGSIEPLEPVVRLPLLG